MPSTMDNPLTMDATETVLPKVNVRLFVGTLFWVSHLEA